MGSNGTTALQKIWRIEDDGTKVGKEPQNLSIVQVAVWRSIALILFHDSIFVVFRFSFCLDQKKKKTISGSKSHGFFYLPSKIRSKEKMTLQPNVLHFYILECWILKIVSSSSSSWFFFLLEFIFIFCAKYKINERQKKTKSVDRTISTANNITT